MKSKTNLMGNYAETDLPSAIAFEFADKIRDTYIPWIRKALSELEDADSSIWVRPNENSNSIGNLLLHLNGNIRQWIIHGLGGAEDNRIRDIEFETESGKSATELLRVLEASVDECCEVVEKFVKKGILTTPLRIQEFKTTGVSAIIHVIEHFAYHTGQIVWSVKAHTNKDMGFYNL
ncbi:DinB family protein [bacterium]|nr:DinB family protein [bacterium]